MFGRLTAAGADWKWCFCGGGPFVQEGIVSGDCPLRWRCAAAPYLPAASPGRIGFIRLPIPAGEKVISLVALCLKRTGTVRGANGGG